MRRITSITATLLLLVAIAQPALAQRYPLTEGWTFRKAGSTDQWMQATVPGTVHSDLNGNGMIGDPLRSCTHKDLQWIEEPDWEYTQTFTLPQNISNKNLELVFEGLDTYAQVLLNGTPILEANNMFRTWRIDVSGKVAPGSNTLLVKFFSAKRYASEQAAKLSFALPGGEWAHIRKAAYHFGWDWAPRLVTAGIWKPVYIDVVEPIRLASAWVKTVSADSKEATLSADFTISSNANTTATIRIFDMDERETLYRESVNVSKGNNIYTPTFSIKKPLLWWPNGMGEQNLYNLALIVDTEDGKELIQTQKLGIRTIEWVNQPDSLGESFYAKVNGMPVFAMGANLVPPHSLLPLADKEWTRLVYDAKESNMNMLRVWGGGVYPPNSFFNACDSLGIMVWQDFMFACSMYPWDKNFLANVRQESVEQVQRLRPHASLAMWCGNNEVDEGWHNWGWQKAFATDTTIAKQIWAGYNALFNQLLPDVVAKEDNGRFYWQSSPKYGWGKKESMTHGDSHYWGVWWGKEPFEKYKQKVPRFMSEYGFQSYPVLSTLKNFGNGADVPDTSLINCHQKHPEGFEIIEKYIKDEGFRYKTIEQKLYVSQIVQVIGYQTAIEAHRFASPSCMGSLYWQMNDCWPAVSWSGIDFFGRWKAVQHRVKQLYQPVYVAPIFDGKRLKINLVSSLPYEFEADIIMHLYGADGTKMGVWKDFFEVLPNKAFTPLDIEITDPGIRSLNLVAIVEVKMGRKHLVTTMGVNKPWGKFRAVNPQIEMTTVTEKGKQYIKLKAKYPAFFVDVYNTTDDLVLKDNFFHMLPDEEYKIEVISGEAKGLKVRSIWNF